MEFYEEDVILEDVEPSKKTRPRQDDEDSLSSTKKTKSTFYEDKARELLRDGYTVVPVYDEVKAEQRRKQFHNTLMTQMPEYRHVKNKETGKIEVPKFQGEHFFHKGGFGALGNPSSFHNMFVRKVRQDAMVVAKELFKELRLLSPELDENTKLEQVIDRMRVLRENAEITPESWHRDETPLRKTVNGRGAEEDDMIFGGWIAFDGPQKFSGLKGSHIDKDNSSIERTFSKVNDSWKRELEKRKQAFIKKYMKEKKNSTVEAAENAWDYAPSTPTGFNKLSPNHQAKLDILKEVFQGNKRVLIPPGHMLIFQQELLHEVEKGDKKTRKQPAYRLFTAWRLTKSDKPLLETDDAFFDEQKVPLLKSFQKVDMWPQAAWRPPAWDNLELWSKTTFNPIFLYDRAIGTGSFAGESKTIIPRYMNSMHDVGRKLAGKFVKSHLQSIEEDIPEVLEDLLKDSPAEWEEKWSDDDLANATNIDENFIQSFMFKPYSAAEKQMYQPTKF